MVKPNYNFAKRQRELAKKAKKEEKLQRKASEGQSAEGEPSADEVAGDDATTPTTPPGV